MYQDILIMYYMIGMQYSKGYMYQVFIICTLVRMVAQLALLRFCYFVLFGREVLVIGIWLSTYKGGIVILVIGYIGLGLGFVIRGILFCLLGGVLVGLVYFLITYEGQDSSYGQDYSDYVIDDVHFFLFLSFCWVRSGGDCCLSLGWGTLGMGLVPQYCMGLPFPL